MDASSFRTNSVSHLWCVVQRFPKPCGHRACVQRHARFATAGTQEACRSLDYADSSCGLACLERPPLLPIRDM
ncbi:hypothetical protein BVV20_11130 [Xanthomonas oryzae pv. oryzae]|nr:hypothetical protein BVV20_11130 [Xanthomonas oryzae pv. oryzae]